jgi:hypothetical protein
MLLVKFYFLNENERLKIEEFIEKSVKEITEEEILKMDDRELLNTYRDYMKYQIFYSNLPHRGKEECSIN